MLSPYSDLLSYECEAGSMNFIVFNRKTLDKDLMTKHYKVIETINCVSSELNNTFVH